MTPRQVNIIVLARLLRTELSKSDDEEFVGYLPIITSLNDLEASLNSEGKI